MQWLNEATRLLFFKKYNLRNRVQAGTNKQLEPFEAKKKIGK